MNNSFIKLCNKIKFEYKNTAFENAEIKNVTSNGKWTFELIVESHPKLEDMLLFKKLLTASFKKVDLKISYRSIVYDKKLIFDYFKYYVINSKIKGKDIFSSLGVDNLSIDNDKNLTVNLFDKNMFEKYKENISKIEKIFDNLKFPNLKITLNLVQEDKKQSKKLKIKNELEAFKKSSSNIDPDLDNDSNQNYNKYKKSDTNRYLELSIKKAHESYEEKVILKGEIYRITKKIIQNEKTLMSIDISDYEEAIKVIYFLSNNNKFPSLEVGKSIEVKGKLSQDKFSGGKTLLGIGIPRIIDDVIKLRKDTSKNKRIELALRTNMSTQDGISTPSEYIKAAKFYGHRAIAITDLDSVQSFPSFYNLVKDKSIIPIYGATLSSIDTRNNIFYGFKDFNLAKEKYVVFDLETTGLSARFNEIIEFGATYVENGVIVKNEQFFIKPTRLIPFSITKLTKITNEDVENAISQKEGIIKIYNILNNNVSVAHNARFDINVCKQKFIENGLDVSNIVCIDTLALSWFLFPDEKKHTLNNLSKRFNVNYVADVAHRADYDANILANVWCGILVKLKKEYQINLSKELDTVDSSKMLGKKFSYEVRMIAKNQLGLKKLFKYITYSLTTNYKNGPKFYLDKWKPDPDLLLGSGTNLSLLWEEVINGTDENINKMIKYFDYIEIPPISTFNYLYSSDWITKEQIEFAYKDLINKAKQNNKICVAVSDARYTYDYQKLIHDIYINAPSLGGGLHWLKKYHEIAVPKFQYLTTDEMISEFTFLNNINLINEIVIDNSNEIASKIDPNIEVIKNKLYVPTFDDSQIKLRDLVYKNAKERYGENIDHRIKNRIDKELNPIIKYGYSVIYWISHKLVLKSNEDGFIVGSRGSVGSSIVANLANITEVNPLEPHYLCANCKYFEWSEDPHILSGWDLPIKRCPKCNEQMINDGHNIPFETFLGFEADKVPDIDLNFTGQYQPIIHSYVRELFGERHTFRAGTIPTIAEKTAFGFCKKYARDVLHDELIWTRSYLDFLASKTQGVKRTTGQHPGGIIIIPKEFDAEDFTPINYPANEVKNSWLTTHFDFELIHDSVLKLDLLGHDVPTIIKMLEDSTNTDSRKIPKMDDKVIKLFYSTDSLNLKPSDISGETTGAYALPEFGTQFVRKMLKESKPQTFNDLILLSGLSHGIGVWTNNTEELVKSGKKLVECVCCRDDIMRNLISWNIDKLESFKIMEAVRKGKGLTNEQEGLLLSKNIPTWYISSLKKIQYMFPRAHATAYVIMAWRIAWYKIYYPLQFYAAYFSTKNDYIYIKILSSGKQFISNKLNELRSKINNNDSSLSTKEKDFVPILEIAQELYARGLKISNIDLMKSKVYEWVIDEKNNTLIPPFVTVEGLGDTAAESVISARKNGEFYSIEDLVNRTKLNSKNINELKALDVLKDLPEANQETLF